MKLQTRFALAVAALLGGIFFAVAQQDAQATTYTAHVTAAFGASKTGNAANAVLYAFDGSGTLRVGPAAYTSATGATVTGPNNEPTATESSDYTFTADTGDYWFAPTLDTAWGPLHIHVVITGLSGVAVDYTIPNEPVLAADQQANTTSSLTTQGYTTVRAAALDTTASSVATAAIQATNAASQTTAANQQSNAAAGVWGAATRTVTGTVTLAAGQSVASVTGAVGSVTAPVTAGTVTDKTGYTLATAPPTAAQLAAAILADPAHLLATDASGDVTYNNTISFPPTVSLSSGDETRLGNLDATVSSRLAASAYTAPDNADVQTALADLVSLLARTDPSTALAAVQAAVAAVKAQTDKLGFDAAGNVKSAPQTAAPPQAGLHE